MNEFPSQSVERYFNWVSSFFGGQERLMGCYADQFFDPGGWGNGHHQNRDNLTTYVFVAGTEGSGHHALEDIAGTMHSYFERVNNDTKQTIMKVVPHMNELTHLDVLDEWYAKFDREEIRQSFVTHGIIDNETETTNSEDDKLLGNATIRKIMFDSQDAYPWNGDSLLLH
jgi:hypothetical protein